MKTNRYAIFVADDNGWFDGCPDYKSVFFGSYNDQGRWLFGNESDLDPALADAAERHQGGVLVVDGYAAAHRVLRALNTTGDWVAPREINEDGIETRPSYAVEKL